MALVEVSGLRKTYGGFNALDGIDLAVPEGAVLGLLGPNGSGKTTTVSILSTLQRPTAGRATVAGYDVVDDAATVRELISLTGQYASLDGALTARENLALFGRLTGLNRGQISGRCDEIAETFALTDFIDRKVDKLSGGMRRRVDIACALITRPRVLFLDEPTTGLDPRSRQVVWETVAELRADGITVLLTTQYLEEADRLADSIVLLDRGSVVARGTPEELKQSAGSALCEITLADPSDISRAHAALSRFDVLSAPENDSGRTKFIVNAPDELSTVRAVVGEFEAAAIPVFDIALRRPSLDEVFFALTGERTESASAGGRGQAGDQVGMGAS